MWFITGRCIILHISHGYLHYNQHVRVAFVFAFLCPPDPRQNPGKRVLFPFCNGSKTVVDRVRVDVFCPA